MYDSFIFYGSFHEACRDLSAEQYGKIMFVLNEYALNGEIPTSFEDPIIKMAFTFMKPQIDANNARKEAGTKGGRPTNRKPVVIENTENEKPMVIENDKNRKPVVIENTENEKPNVNVNDNVNVNVNDIAAEPAAVPAKNKPSSKPKTEKPSLREREPENDMERIEKAYLTQWDTLYTSGVLKTPEPPSGMWTECRAHIKQHLNNGVTVDQIIKAIDTARQDDWVMRGGYLLKTILSSGVFNRLVNGKPDKHETINGKPLLQNDIDAMHNMGEFMAQNERNMQRFSVYAPVGEVNDENIW